MSSDDVVLRIKKYYGYGLRMGIFYIPQRRVPKFWTSGYKWVDFFIDEKYAAISPSHFSIESLSKCKDIEFSKRILQTYREAHLDDHIVYELREVTGDSI